MHSKYILVLLTLIILSPASLQFVKGQTCGLNYQLLNSSGTIYGLTGMYGFVGLPNQTSVTVTGKLLQANSSDFIHPNPNYGGTIIVLLLQSSSTTQSWYSVTVVEVQSSTWTTVQANNPAPLSQTVSVAGLLITHYGNCVQPLISGSQSAESEIVAVAIVIVFVGLIIVNKRKQK